MSSCVRTTPSSRQRFASSIMTPMSLAVVALGLLATAPTGLERLRVASSFRASVLPA